MTVSRRQPMWRRTIATRPRSRRMPKFLPHQPHPQEVNFIPKCFPAKKIGQEQFVTKFSWIPSEFCYKSPHTPNIWPQFYIPLFAHTRYFGCHAQICTNTFISLIYFEIEPNCRAPTPSFTKSNAEKWSFFIIISFYSKFKKKSLSHLHIFIESPVLE